MKRRKTHRRRSNSLTKDITGFTKSSVALGIGTAVVSSAQSGSGVSVTPAFATMGSMMSPVATGMMGKHAIRNISKLKQRRRRKRK